MKKAIVIGASSGIGRELAKVLSQNGYTVGLVGRRLNLLADLQKEIPAKTYIKQIDVSEVFDAMNLLDELIGEMNGVDLVIINAGTGFINPNLDWEKEKDTIDLNVSGFAAMANVAVSHFCRQASGHIVGISSIAALRGHGRTPAYNASKAFMSNYLEGLRQKFGRQRIPIAVTDIQPGFVDTPMLKAEGLFWVASAEKAAGQIFEAIRKKRKHAYITKRWRIIAWLLRIVPDSIYNRF